MNITKQEYYGNKINSSSNPSKETWKLIKSQLKISEEHESKLQINDNLINDSKELAGHFAEYFATMPATRENTYFRSDAVLKECTTYPSVVGTMFC